MVGFLIVYGMFITFVLGGVMIPKLREVFLDWLNELWPQRKAEIHVINVRPNEPETEDAIEKLPLSADEKEELRQYISQARMLEDKHDE